MLAGAAIINKSASRQVTYFLTRARKMTSRNRKFCPLSFAASCQAIVTSATMIIAKPTFHTYLLGKQATQIVSWAPLPEVKSATGFSFVLFVFFLFWLLVMDYWQRTKQSPSQQIMQSSVPGLFKRCCLVAMLHFAWSQAFLVPHSSIMLLSDNPQP